MEPEVSDLKNKLQHQDQIGVNPPFYQSYCLIRNYHNLMQEMKKVLVWNLWRRYVFKSEVIHIRDNIITQRNISIEYQVIEN